MKKIFSCGIVALSVASFFSCSNKQNENSMKIKIDPTLFDKNKFFTLGILKSNVSIKKSKDFEELLQKKSSLIEEELKGKNLQELDEIKFLRETYKSNGLKLSDYIGSNEALLKRIVTGKGIYYINNLVDINNYMSLVSRRSLGSYDVDKLVGDIEFRLGNEGEVYTGTTNRPMKLKGLTLLSDNEGPFGSPTSDSKKALISEETTNAITIIFSFDGSNGVENQLNELEQLIVKYADGNNITKFILSSEKEEVEI